MKEQAQLTCTVSYSVGGLLFGVVLYRWRLITLVRGEARAALSLWLLQTLSQAENRRGRAGCRSVEQRHYAASIALSEADQPEPVGALRWKK